MRPAVEAAAPPRAAPLRHLAALLLVAVAGCTQKAEFIPPSGAVAVQPPAAEPVLRSAVPPPRPASAIRVARAQSVAAAVEKARNASSTRASRTMSAYYAGIEDHLTAQGKLRHDDSRGAPEVDTLVENFIRIALFDEYRFDGEQLVPSATPSTLKRWEKPVRIAVEFGDSVPPGTRTRDRAEVQRFAERLARVTGFDIAHTPSAGNFTVMFLSEDERRQIAPRLRRAIPDIPATDVTLLSNLSPETHCTVFAYSRTGRSDYTDAVAVIRAELPPRMRSSCIHEEISQGLGLANDHPQVRPSIFNDDETYGFLTRHDELLLAMLYDRRLRPGMTQDSARPLLARIARDHLTGRPN